MSDTKRERKNAYARFKLIFPELIKICEIREAESTATKDYAMAKLSHEAKIHLMEYGHSAELSKVADLFEKEMNTDKEDGK